MPDSDRIAPTVTTSQSPGGLGAAVDRAHAAPSAGTATTAAMTAHETNASCDSPWSSVDVPPRCCDR